MIPTLIRRGSLLALLLFLAGALPSSAQLPLGPPKDGRFPDGKVPELVIESCRRWDTTGNGPPSQQGLYEIVKESTEELGKPLTTEPAASTSDFADEFHKYVSVEGRASLMWMGSDNMFNTRDSRTSDSLYALFTGASLDLSFEEFVLANRYDRAFYRYQRTAFYDFNSDTVGSSLSRTFWFLDNKLSFTPQMGWEYSEFRLRAGDVMFFRQHAWSTGGLVSYAAADWVSVNLNTTYAFQDVITNDSTDKHKVDVGLSASFTPWKDIPLNFTPSFQFSRENFRITPQENSTYTSSVTASWTPLSFLALDLTGSHSANNASGADVQASYEAMSVTAMLRAFYRW